MAEEVGAAFVSLVPSARGFSAAARRELASELRGVDIPIAVIPEVDRGQLTAALTGATAGQRGAVLVNTDVDATQLLRETRGAAREVEATRPTVTVQTDVDKDSLRRSIRAASGAAERGGGDLSRLFVSGFGGGLLNPLIGIPAVAAAALISVPGAAAVAAATLAGASLGAIFVGAFALRADPELKQAAAGFLTLLDQTLTKAAAPLKQPFLQALGILSDTVVSIAPDLHDLFAAVAPFIPVLAQGVSEFVKAFTPELVDAVKASAPVIDQIAMALPDLGDALGQFLESMALVAPQAATFIGQLLRLLADVIRTTGDVIRFLTGMYDNFVTFIKGIGEVFREAAIGWGYILRIIGGDTELLKTMMHNAADIIARWWAKLWGIDLPRSTSQGVTALVGQAKAVPGKIVAAVGDLGHLLYDAGRSILQGLIDGIKSKFSGAGSLSSAMSDAASLARAFWPFSPAKMGPLSGHGSLYYAGQNLVGDLTGGMANQLPRVAGASAQLAGAIGAGSGRGGGMAAAPPTLRIGSDGSRLGDLLVEVLQTAVREKGGNVQVVLGA